MVGCNELHMSAAFVLDLVSLKCEVLSSLYQDEIENKWV